MAEAAAAFQVGDRLHQYELVAILGRGGHAVVYHGFDRASDRHVAIKVLHDAKHDLRQRARAEGRLLISLRHTNLVEVYDAGVTESGSVYIVMERLEGRSLRELLVRLRKLTVLDALPIGVQVARGVLAAHARKVIHRDLKPDNIYVQPDGTIKVLDFGIAKYLEQSFDTTQQHVLQGTPSYMAPEQFQGLPVSYRSDVFALGVVLYELLAGVKPSHVDGDPKNVDDFVERQLLADPPPLHVLEPRVSATLSGLVGRALAKRAEDRLDLEEFLVAMERELDRERRRSGAGAPRDLLRSCLEVTDPGFAPEFTAESQRVTDRVCLRTAEGTLAGLGTEHPRAELSGGVVTERLFEGELTNVTRTAVPPAITPMVRELGTPPPLTEDAPGRGRVSRAAWLGLVVLAMAGLISGLALLRVRGARSSASASAKVSPALSAEPPPKGARVELRRAPVLAVKQEAASVAAAGPPEAPTVGMAAAPRRTRLRSALSANSTSRSAVENPRSVGFEAGREVRAQRDSDLLSRVGSGLPEPTQVPAPPGTKALD